MNVYGFPRGDSWEQAGDGGNVNPELACSHNWLLPIFPLWNEQLNGGKPYQILSQAIEMEEQEEKPSEEKPLPRGALNSRGSNLK